MSLEELLNIEVTSVSKKAEKRTEAAAAIFVITSEDIRRSGVRSIPDALRMVPGLAVAQLDANKWSVSSRGFAGRFSFKLLVLIDGRSVYTPQFGGVYWEAQDVVFEDIDRIEVIRGPGGALWGANAVNGVINIVTKSAADTQGALISVGGGTEDLGFTTLRYGGAIENDRGHYRVYGKFIERDTGATITGSDADDDSSMVQGGFRVDSKLSLRDTLTVQGDVYEHRSGSENISPTLTLAEVS
ncbi:MAG: TonB-dependent receptor plug domain-containing protein, partial [Candidatus Hydrogenedentes bacterium]|nr:TonB-dependent receptor plug domain-containing protein [Candidatus Hydrogenedentota bacterium]